MSDSENTIGKFIAEQILRGQAGNVIEPERPILEEGLLDSLGLQQLVMFIEKEFSVKFVDDYLVPDNFASVRALAKLVDSVKA